MSQFCQNIQVGRNDIIEVLDSEPLTGKGENFNTSGMNELSVTQEDKPNQAFSMDIRESLTGGDTGQNTTFERIHR